jgi:hypothetical protein
MKRGQQAKSGQGKRKQGRNSTPQTLAGHKAFAPMVGLWGALLGGLVVAVLPGTLIRSALAGTLIGTWEIDPQPLLAGTAAVVLGTALFAFAWDRHSRSRQGWSGPSVVDRALRQGVTPINPVRDLGSRSLDDPLDAMPFTTPAWRDADLDIQRPAPRPVASPEPAPAPVELDLSEFAQLPNRNAVWVEEPAAGVTDVVPEHEHEHEAEPEPEPAAPQPDPVADIRARRLRAVTTVPPVPGTAALARLRAVPTEALSLAEMVERFAGALHEHRETTPVRNLGPADLAAREAALAEALKALAALSGGTPAATARPPRDEPLRAALAQLQPRRGAA